MSDPPEAPRSGRISASAPASKSETPSDREVIERARAGDHEAFRVLVERYQDRAFRLALRVLRDEELARDVVQEGFLNAYRSLDRFEGRSNFFTWLYRVIMNLCIDARRRDRFSNRVEWDEQSALKTSAALEADALNPLSQELGAPSAAMEGAELRAEVARAIETLPDDARQTLLLREVEGLSYAEIAKALSIKKGTVMSRLHYARRRVREVLLASGVVAATNDDGEES